MILTCSGSNVELSSSNQFDTAVILSRVSKLDSVTILPNTVYSPSRKVESCMNYEKL